VFFLWWQSNARAALFMFFFVGCILNAMEKIPIE